MDHPGNDLSFKQGDCKCDINKNAEEDHKEYGDNGLHPVEIPLESEHTESNTDENTSNNDRLICGVDKDICDGQNRELSTVDLSSDKIANKSMSFLRYNGLTCNMLHNRNDSHIQNSDPPNIRVITQDFDGDTEGSTLPGAACGIVSDVHNISAHYSSVLECSAWHINQEAESTTVSLQSDQDLKADTVHTFSKHSYLDGDPKHVNPEPHGLDSSGQCENPCQDIEQEKSDVCHSDTDDLLSMPSNEVKINNSQNSRPESDPHSGNHSDKWLEGNLQDVSRDYSPNSETLPYLWTPIDRGEDCETNVEGDIEDPGGSMHEFLDWSVSLSDLTSMHSTSCATNSSGLQLQGILSTSDAPGIMSSSALAANQFDNASQGLVSSNSVFWTSRPENHPKRPYDSRAYFEINSIRPVLDYWEGHTDSEAGEELVDQIHSDDADSISQDCSAHQNTRSSDHGDIRATDSNRANIQGGIAALSEINVSSEELARAIGNSCGSSSPSPSTSTNSSEQLTGVAMEISSVGAHSLLQEGDDGVVTVSSSSLEDGTDFVTNENRSVASLGSSQHHTINSDGFNSDGLQTLDYSTTICGGGLDISQRKHHRQKKKTDKRALKFKKFEKMQRTKIRQKLKAGLGSPAPYTDDQDVLSDVHESLTCPVCLDVYYNAHSCQPCGHVFCEPCLRRLAKYSSDQARDTGCPICRELIQSCVKNQDVTNHVELFLPNDFRRRRRAERSNKYMSHPLPSLPSPLSLSIPRAQLLARVNARRRRPHWSSRRTLWGFIALLVILILLKGLVLAILLVSYYYVSALLFGSEETQPVVTALRNGEQLVDL